MIDRITSMQVFIKVIQTGSFSATGRFLNLSPTMVTKHINALEQRLNCTLFNRSTRKLSLTEAGNLFYKGCEKILSDLDAIEHTITSQHIRPSGTLKINAPIAFTQRHISPLLCQFIEQYPDITIELGLNDRLVDLVEEGWDISLRIGKLNSSSLKARKLTNIEFILCAAPSYLQQYGTPQSIFDLPHHSCLRYSLGTLMGHSSWKFGVKGEHTIPIKGPITANNGEILRDAAILGKGIVYLPKFLLDQELKEKKLIQLSLDYPLIEEAGLYIMYAPLDYIPLKIRVMIDYLVQQFTPKAPWDHI